MENLAALLLFEIDSDYFWTRKSHPKESVGSGFGLLLKGSNLQHTPTCYTRKYGTVHIATNSTMVKAVFFPLAGGSPISRAHSHEMEKV
jgi:hypothetical protein